MRSTIINCSVMEKRTRSIELLLLSLTLLSLDTEAIPYICRMFVR